MLVNGSDFYCGNTSGSPCQLALKNQIPSQYVHPSTKQCNYSVDLSGYATSSELNSLKTSVSNGKSLIANAITGKGVATSSSESFASFASKITNLPSGNVNMIKIQANSDGYFTVPPLGVAPNHILFWSRRGVDESDYFYIAAIDFLNSNFRSFTGNQYDQLPSTQINGEGSYVTATAELFKTSYLKFYDRPNYFYQNSMIWVYYH